MLGHLLSPVSIGGLHLRNRIAMAPMGVDLVEGDGRVREPTLRYYEERARGGTGLLITENTAACYPRGANSAHEIAVSDDVYLPGLSALTRTVHAHGAKIAIQLAHHGKVGRLDVQQGRELLMPSLPREHGAPMGNFGAAMINKNESWVTVSEFMWPAWNAKARKKGAAGKTLVARILWAEPNRRTP